MRDRPQRDSNPCFGLGNVTTGDTLKVSFQDIDFATGHPDGGADQFRTIAIATGDANKWIDINSTPALGVLTSDGTNSGTKRSVVRGASNPFAVVIEFNSYVAGNLLILNTSLGVNRGQLVGFNVVDYWTTSWAKQFAVGANIALAYNDGTYAYLPGAYPNYNMSATTFNSSSAGFDEAGLWFKFPFACAIGGAWANWNANAGDTSLTLYRGSTQLDNLLIDKDVVNTAGIPIGVYFTSDFAFAANEIGRLTYRPGTQNISVPWEQVGNTTVGVPMVAGYLGGAQCQWTQRLDLGTFSELGYQRPYMGLMVTQLDDGSGGSGAAGGNYVWTA